MSDISALESDGSQRVEVVHLLSDADFPKHRSCNYQSVRNSVLAIIFFAAAVMSIFYSTKDAPSEINQAGVEAVVGLSAWDTHIDSIIRHSKGNCDKVAIIGLDSGSKLSADAHKSALKITAAEAQKLSDDLKMPLDSASFFSQSLAIAGTKYFFLSHINHNTFFFKLKGHGGITVQKTKTAIIIAHTAEGKQQGVTNMGVKEIAEHLSSSGMRRLRHGSYARRLHRQTAEQGVVVQLGSGKTIVGFGGDEEPKYIQPSVVGVPIHRGSAVKESYVVGDEAMMKRDELKLHYPIQRGKITNFDDFEKLLFNAFEELKIAPDDESMILAEAPLTSSEMREKLTEIVFGQYSSPNFFLANNAVLATYSFDRSTAMVLYIGEGEAFAVPVYEGHAINHATIPLEFGGADLTDYLMKLLSERGYEFSAENGDRPTVDAIKRKLGYVALDFEEEMGYPHSRVVKSYTLPDGQEITLGSGRFRVAEALFKPSFIGVDTPGIHGIVHNSIMKLPEDLRPEMYANVLIAGSETHFLGLEDRLQQELEELAPPEFVVKVKERAHSVDATWIGGSILSGLPSFPLSTIAKQEYDEFGASVVHYKCF